MRMLSKRAALERSSTGIGVTVAARKYWRAYYIQQGGASGAGMTGRNQEINEYIAGDAGGAKPLHRFLLKSGEVAEIRQSHKFYYICVLQGPGRIDRVIAIQPTFKNVPDDVAKQRMTDDWIQIARKI